jgi:hypothetical protein
MSARRIEVIRAEIETEFRQGNRQFNELDGASGDNSPAILLARAEGCSVADREGHASQQ